MRKRFEVLKAFQYVFFCQTEFITADLLYEVCVDLIVVPKKRKLYSGKIVFGRNHSYLIGTRNKLGNILTDICFITGDLACDYMALGLKIRIHRSVVIQMLFVEIEEYGNMRCGLGILELMTGQFENDYRISGSIVVIIKAGKTYVSRKDDFLSRQFTQHVGKHRNRRGLSLGSCDAHGLHTVFVQKYLGL